MELIVDMNDDENVIASPMLMDVIDFDDIHAVDDKIHDASRDDVTTGRLSCVLLFASSQEHTHVVHVFEKRYRDGTALLTVNMTCDDVRWLSEHLTTVRITSDDSTILNCEVASITSVTVSSVGVNYIVVLQLELNE